MDILPSVNSTFLPEDLEETDKYPIENEEFSFFDWDIDVQIAIAVTCIIGLALLSRIINAFYLDWRRRQDAQRAQEIEPPEQAERRRANAQRRIDQALQQTEHECPICLLTPANFPVLTDCGHIFCCQCIIQYWQTSKAIITPCDCAICRSTFHMLLPVRWPNDIDNEDAIHENNMRIDDYNRRFSMNRPFLEYIRDIPVLIPYLLRNFFQHDLFDIVYQVRVGFVFFMLIIYLLVPTDMIPESAYGIIGLMDDFVVALVVAGSLIRWFRNYMAQRGLARQD